MKGKGGKGRGGEDRGRKRPRAAGRDPSRAGVRTFQEQPPGWPAGSLDPGPRTGARGPVAFGLPPRAPGHAGILRNNLRFSDALKKRYRQEISSCRSSRAAAFKDFKAIFVEAGTASLAAAAAAAASFFAGAPVPKITALFLRYGLPLLCFVKVDCPPPPRRPSRTDRVAYA